MECFVWDLSFVICSARKFPLGVFVFVGDADKALALAASPPGAFPSSAPALSSGSGSRVIPLFGGEAASRGAGEGGTASESEPSSTCSSSSRSIFPRAFCPAAAFSETPRAAPSPRSIANMSCEAVVAVRAAAAAAGSGVLERGGDGEDDDDKEGATASIGVLFLSRSLSGRVNENPALLVLATRRAWTPHESTGEKEKRG